MALASCVSAQSNDIAKYDPNMAIDNAIVTIKICISVLYLRN